MSQKIERSLFVDIAQIIENGKRQIIAQVNSVLTLTYWQIGKKINEHYLNNRRAEYGKEIVSPLSEQLVEQFGRSFELKNLYRMMQFSEIFPEFDNVVTLSRHLSWSHFVVLLPLKNAEQRNYYVQKIATERWSVRDTRFQVERKAYERNEIASLQLTDELYEAQSSFKDPYIFDFLGLKDGYLEKDLETAIIRELENFILELGKGFTFIERQKRMIIDGEDFYLDLLFYHRKLQRLVAIELKYGKFKASYKGQMNLYLKWLDKYERQKHEDSPIGLILCAGKSSEQIELLEMHKEGIMVADYWTDLPPKAELEKKLHQIMIEARERIELRKICD